MTQGEMPDSLQNLSMVVEKGGENPISGEDFKRLLEEISAEATAKFQEAERDLAAKYPSFEKLQTGGGMLPAQAHAGEKPNSMPTVNLEAVAQTVLEEVNRFRQFTETKIAGQVRVLLEALIKQPVSDQETELETPDLKEYVSPKLLQAGDTAIVFSSPNPKEVQVYQVLSASNVQEEGVRVFIAIKDKTIALSEKNHKKEQTNRADIFVYIEKDNLTIQIDFSEEGGTMAFHQVACLGVKGDPESISGYIQALAANELQTAVVDWFNGRYDKK